MSYSTNRHGQRPFRGLFVVGPYRSGTSLVSQILNRLGADFGSEGELIGPDLHNPGGYFERDDINSANSDLILSAGYSLGNPGTPEEILRKAGRRSLRELDLRSLTAASLWAIKDPRLCLTLSVWLEERIGGDGAVAIVRVLRSQTAAAASAALHPFLAERATASPEEAFAMTQSYDRGAQWHVAHSRIPVLEIHYEELVRNPEESVQRLAEFIGTEDLRSIEAGVSCVGKNESLRRFRWSRFQSAFKVRVGTWRDRLFGRKS